MGVTMLALRELYLCIVVLDIGLDNQNTTYQLINPAILEPLGAFFGNVHLNIYGRIGKWRYTTPIILNLGVRQK
jgi:hypothetical protein